MSDRLIELAERCEAATKPDRQLSDAIFELATFDDERLAYPHYTASVDLALTLVPDQWAWMVEYVGVDPYPPCRANLWVPAQREDGRNRRRCLAEAQTPALAICAAALRARAAS